MTKRSTFALLISFLIASGLSAQSPTIDGVFDEWTPASQIATDPSGDNTGAFDVTTVSAATNGSVLFLHFDIGRVINLQNGDKADGTLKLKLSAGNRAIDIDFRKRTATDKAGKRVGWKELGFQCLPTYASDKYEIRVDLSYMGVKPGDNVNLQFAGSDSLEQPVQITLTEPTNQVGTSIDWQKPSGAFRVVNQNTLQNGLADPDRQGKFQRLFAAANADVYCFQEEWDKPKFLAGVVKTVPSNGQPIKYAWEGGCAMQQL